MKKQILITLCLGIIAFLGFFIPVYALPIAQILLGGTGTSTAPGINKLYIGGPNNEVEYIATSSLGITSGSGTVTSITASSPLTGGTITTTGSIGCQTASGSQAGCLASADWTTFNNKQASGNYITALTGDISASGPGSAATTLATVNSNTGSFGGATSIPTFTVNGKGLITAASAVTPSIPVGDITGTLPVSNGGTGAATFGQGWLESPGGTNIFISSTSPTVNYITSTSTTATSTFAAAITVGAGQGTSTFAGGISAKNVNLTSTTASSTASNGFNLTAGCFAINGACVGGSGGSGTVTSIAVTTPTGISVSPSSITTNGTFAFTLSSSAFSLLKLPTYTVGASGADFTTIQAALNACGTAGGGSIDLTDTLYAQAGTGLLWKGSNCSVWGRGVGTTTITFTGATTGFKTNSAVSTYSHDEIHNLLISGDGNTSGVGIDESDMSHNLYDGIQITDFGTDVRLNDTQNITFYNTFSNFDFNNVQKFGVNASSTNPANADVFSNGFIGCNAANCIGVNLNNNQEVNFDNVRIEPTQGLSGTIGVQIADSGNGTSATNNGTFDNIFTGAYIEGSSIGVKATAPIINIFGNQFIGGTIEQNAAGCTSNCKDLVDTSNGGVLLQGTDLEFNTVSAEPNLSIGTSTNSTPFQIQVINNSSAQASLTSAFLQNNTNFAYVGTGGLMNIKLLNSSDTGPALRIDDAGTKSAAIYVATGKIGVGSTTPVGATVITTAASSTPNLILDDTTNGGCIIMRDAGSGRGFTELYTVAGVLLSKVTTSITTCN